MFLTMEHRIHDLNAFQKCGENEFSLQDNLYSQQFFLAKVMNGNIPVKFQKTREKQLFRGLMLLFFIAAFLSSCDSATSPQEELEQTVAADHDAAVATAWFDLSLRLIEETNGFSPPVASRALSYMGVTLYESVVPGMPANSSLAGQLNDLEPLHQPDSRVYWPAAANSALAEISRKLFRSTDPELLKAIDDLQDSLTREFRSRTDDVLLDRSVKYGKQVAEVIYNWSKTDGGHEGFAHNFFDDYKAPSGSGMWVPTPPDYLPALQPAWGNNRPFALTTSDDCPLNPHPVYSEAQGSAFYTEALEVYETVGQLSEEQREIALFWADDPGKTPTPPGHWISILNQVINVHNHSLDVAAEAYARLGIALADAFIFCWYEKYQYNLIRPISFIQQVIDATWNTPEVTDPVITPPFPEYPSGHSVQSGAAAIVLTSLFGEVVFTDRTHEARGLPARSFYSFWEAAEEAAISRLYGGIHYRAAIDFGVEHGRCIGEKVGKIEF
jgi:hypothetical protein